MTRTSQRLLTASSLLIALALICAYYFVPSLRATDGVFSVLIDDAYIHAVYARGFFHGELYPWGQAGYSPGATSPLYPLALAVGYAIGFRGTSIMFFAMLLNAAALFLSIAAIPPLIRYHRKNWGYPLLFAALALGLSPLTWALGSGMETLFSLGLVAIFLLAVERDLRSPAARGFRWQTLLSASLLPLGRPDWLVIPAFFFLITLLTHWRRWGWRSWLTPPLTPLPLLAVFGINYLNLGHLTPASSPLKSLWSVEVMSMDERWRAFTGNLFVMPQHLFKACFDVRWGATALTIFIMLALVYLGRGLLARQRRIAFDIAAVLSIIAMLMLNACLRDPSTTYFRYYVAVLLLTVILGGRMANEWNRLCLQSRRQLHRRWVVHLLRAVPLILVALLIPGMLRATAAGHTLFKNIWLAHYQNHIITSEHLRAFRELHPEIQSPILIHDAGATEYFAPGAYVDLLGLCSDDLPHSSVRQVDYYRQNANLFFEAIEHFPQNRWPEFALVYEMFADLPFVYNPVLWQATPEPIDTRSYPENVQLGFYRFPRELLCSGHTPQLKPLPEGWQITDRFDVADMISERDHRFRVHWQEDPERPRIFRFQMNGTANGPVGDCGRRLYTPAEFILNRENPKNPAQVWGRLAGRGGRAHIRGVDMAQEVQLPFEDNETMGIFTLLELPPGTDTSLSVRIEPTAHNFEVYQIWLIESADDSGSQTLVAE